jgi:hypothetical protein
VAVAGYCGGDIVITFSGSDLRNILRLRCEAAGGQKDWATANGVSAQFVCDVLAGRRNVSARLAKILGYQRQIVFSACNTQKGDT